MSARHILRYCPDLYHYQRRETREVMVGKVGIGGDNPIRVQSMITSDTRDAAACVEEALGLVEAGCEIVRVTAQTRVIAANLEHIKAGLLAAGCDVPLVADIHFKPDAAMEAAKWVEKVRVNPGNYVDKKKFAVREYTDEEYAEELAAIEEAFMPLVQLCMENGRAMRIGTNHGSPLRPHHEPLRRHAARHGGERAGVRPHRAARRLSQFRLLHEGQQSEGDDRGLPPARRAAQRPGR